MENIGRVNDEIKMLKFSDEYREILLKAKKKGIIALKEDYILGHEVNFKFENNEIRPQVNDLPEEVLNEITKLWNDINKI